MNNFNKVVCKIIIWSTIIFLFSFVNTNPQQSIRAKIAIMLVRGDNSFSLKSNDRLFAGDSVWIFVQPLTPIFAYVIYSDEKVSKLLKNEEFSDMNITRLEIGDTLILPSRNHLYVVDDECNTAKFTIICSGSRIPQIESHFSNTLEIERKIWEMTEKKLMESYYKNLTSGQDKPLLIGGNVRGEKIGEFLNRQPIFESKDKIIRIYNIEIKR